MQVEIRDFIEAITCDNLGCISKATNGNVETTDFILAAMVSNRRNFPAFSPH